MGFLGQGNFAKGLQADEPTIYNVSTTANVENSQALSNNTKLFIVRARGTSSTRIAFGSGDTATNYVTIARGAVYESPPVDLRNKTLYIRTDKNDTIEILEWT